MIARLETADSKIPEPYRGVVLISENPEEEAMLKRLWSHCHATETERVGNQSTGYIILVIVPE